MSVGFLKRFFRCFLRDNIVFRRFFQEFRMRRKMFFKGINVILTYRCNLKCDYCYEQGVSHVQDMTMSDFDSMLGWLKRHKKDKLILLGGEPTQHAQFQEILALCDEYKFKVAILTNMLMSAQAQKNIAQYKGHIMLQANINHPSTYHNGAYEQVVQTARYLYSRVQTLALRYNLYEKNYDFSAILRLAKELQSPIRFSVTNSPLVCEGKEKLVRQHKDEWAGNKEIIMAFVRACNEQNIGAFFARPIPGCLFDAKQKKEYVRNGIKHKCHIGRENDYAARLNVAPDLSIMGCYGVPITGPRLTDFETYYDLSQFFKKDIMELRKIPLFAECKECGMYGQGECQGGCLSEKKEWYV